MDHSHMDHSHMDHGDMDMGDQCSMNVSQTPFCLYRSLTNTDALHVVVQESLYHFPTMACDWYILAAYILDRDRDPDRRLRVGAGYK